MARFYKSPTWKHIVTRRDSTPVTDLSRLASDRSARFELGRSATLTGFVPSHDFRVYFPTDDNFDYADFDQFWQWNYPVQPPIDFPRLEEGMRLMYSFRREGLSGTDDGPWVVRHAGLVLELEDNADPNRRLSSFTVYDPWQYLYRRPCRIADLINIWPDPDPTSMPGEMGVVFPAGTTGDEIVGELLLRTIDQDGDAYIDAGLTYGGTALWGGTIETTEAFVDEVIFPRGMSVGEAWDQMVDTQTLDIVLTPIWDPINRPGYCAELSIFNTAGVTSGQSPWDVSYPPDPFPVFHWDRVGRSITRLSRTTDGRERANRIRAFIGGSGQQNSPWTQMIPNSAPFKYSEDDAASWSEADSNARYGEYWHQEAYIRATRSGTVDKQSFDELIRRRVADRSWRFDPAPEFSPRPFQDYMPGSFVGFSHSEKLRSDAWWLPWDYGTGQRIFPRIFGFTIELDDNSLETVRDMDILLDTKTNYPS